MTGFPPPEKPQRADYDVPPAGFNPGDQQRYVPPPPVPPYSTQNGAQGVGAYPPPPPPPQYSDAPPFGSTGPSPTGTTLQTTVTGQPADGQYTHTHVPVINATTNKPVPYEMHQEIFVLHSSAGMPLLMPCQSCGAQVVTEVHRRPGVLALLTSILCCFTCCWPCFFLPFCTPGCMARVHKCPRCHKIVAVEP